MALTKKVMGAVAAIALILTTILTFAFKAEDGKNENKKLATVWYFDGNSSQIKDASHWRSSGSTPSDCDDEGTRPCSILVDATTEAQLQSFLTPKSESEITNLSVQKRP